MTEIVGIILLSAPFVFLILSLCDRTNTDF